MSVADEDKLAEAKALIDEADALLRIAEHSMRKFGLAGRGDDLSLPHEARMFSLNFSRDEPADGVFRKGSGALQNWRARARDLFRQQPESEAGA